MEAYNTAYILGVFSTSADFNFELPSLTVTDLTVLPP